MSFVNKINKLKNYLSDNGERPIVCKYYEDMPFCFTFGYNVAAKYIKNKTVLDFGCGGGYGTEYLSRFTEKKTTGYDIDDKTIKTNQEFFKKNKKIQFTSNLNSLGSFDTIVCLQVIEHVSPKKHSQFIKNLNKHLNPRGTIIFTTPNKKYYFVWIKETYHGISPLRIYPSKTKTASKKTLFEINYKRPTI